MQKSDSDTINSDSISHDESDDSFVVEFEDSVKDESLEKSGSDTIHCDSIINDQSDDGSVKAVQEQSDDEILSTVESEETVKNESLERSITPKAAATISKAHDTKTATFESVANVQKNKIPTVEDQMMSHRKFGKFTKAN